MSQKSVTIFLPAPMQSGKVKLFGGAELKQVVVYIEGENGVKQIQAFSDTPFPWVTVVLADEDNTIYKFSGIPFILQINS